jgi:hypothetical protein
MRTFMVGVDRASPQLIEAWGQQPLTFIVFPESGRPPDVLRRGLVLCYRRYGRS